MLKKMLVAGLVCIASLAEAITLVSPKDGAVVALLNEKQRAFMRRPREERAAFFDDSQPNAPKYSAQYAESAPQPSTTSGQGPPFFTIAGIHESVANQNSSPFLNHSRKLSFASLLRANHRSGASAKRQSVFSATGGKDAQSRNPGRYHAAFMAFFNTRGIIQDSS